MRGLCGHNFCDADFSVLIPFALLVVSPQPNLDNAKRG